MKIGVETRFEKKQPVETYQLFPQIYTKKSQVWAFGTDFEWILAIPNIWLFGHLGKNTNYGRHPICVQCINVNFG
jgi:hypothetical protein